MKLLLLPFLIVATVSATQKVPLGVAGGRELNSGGCSQPTGDQKYELVRVLDVAGRQGIATDGERYFVSGTKALYVYSRDGELLNSNEDPFVDLDPEKPANHFGDISYHKGLLYTGAEWFEDGRGRDIQAAVYNATTLKFKAALPWNPESGQVESSSIAVDAANDLVWTTDWVNGNYVYRYRLSDGRYAGKLHLRAVPQWQQGIAAHGGSLFITADDGNADRKEVDNLWRVPAEPNASAAYVQHELAFDQLRDLGEIEGIDFDEAAGEMLVLSNRGRQIVLGMPKGLYPGYDREISEINVFQIKEAPQSISGDDGTPSLANDTPSSAAWVTVAGKSIVMMFAIIGAVGMMLLD